MCGPDLALVVVLGLGECAATNHVMLISPSVDPRTKCPGEPDGSATTLYVRVHYSEV